MQEFCTPVTYVVKPDDNVTDDIFAHEKNRPDAVGLERKVNGAWTPVTWREFAGQVRGLAAGFIAAGIRGGPERCPGLRTAGLGLLTVCRMRTSRRPAHSLG
jgi:long-subunit acyl-CoA synthetase (AMP-forming)